MNRYQSIFVGRSLLVTLVVWMTVALASHLEAAGIVDSIVKAPNVADGNVAGADTDLVVNDDISLDPTVNGRS